jgi:hypothetical protein
MCGKLELMSPSKHELVHFKLGTNLLPIVNLLLLEHSHIKEATNIKVRIGNYFIALVVAQISTQVYLSHSIFSSYGCPLPLLITFFAPYFPMARERGNPKRGLAYYNYIPRHHRLGPSVEPVPALIAQDHHVGPPLNFPLRSTQNWMEEDQPMAYVEE